MRLAITCNGPGETAGWLTPLLRALYARDPALEAEIFFVPDDYASGREAQYVRAQFPHAKVFDPKQYLRAALGAHVDGAAAGVDAVLYLGGDLMHAARLHKRFGGALATYKFSRPRIARETARAFSVDANNERDLIRSGVPYDRIYRAGNLAIDGALAQAALPYELDDPLDVLFMPGSRRYEVEHLVPFFFTAAVRMLREQPGLRLAFGLSPFTDFARVESAIERGGDPRVFARRGIVLRDGTTPALAEHDSGPRVPLLRHALAAASRAKLVVTIPGTKVIELAAIGVPVIACTLLNAPELVTINGPLTYLDRIPLAGPAVKRSVVANYARRFHFHTQPNIDAGSELVRELHGTLTPGRVARAALDLLADNTARTAQSQAMRELYREHEGASDRMAAQLLNLTGTNVS